MKHTFTLYSCILFCLLTLLGYANRAVAQLPDAHLITQARILQASDSPPPAVFMPFGRSLMFEQTALDPMSLLDLNAFFQQKIYEILFSNEQLDVYTVYPNPANEQASIEYALKLDGVVAKISISDVLGTQMGEFPLTYGNSSIKIPTKQYESGVYFYTLVVNNKIIITKKLIVKHQY
ncbi:MAG TPA: hypothetical protein DCM08_02515 [Microscillaceae bacterium]|jgi:hypothetical protein|nr:hypothetical protein [Microscillaceae bacterium]